MEAWTIFDRPADYPQHYVLRRFVYHMGRVYATSTVFISYNLEQLRAAVPPGLMRFPRDPLDEPAIVETWL